MQGEIWKLFDPDVYRVSFSKCGKDEFYFEKVELAMTFFVSFFVSRQKMKTPASVVTEGHLLTRRKLKHQLPLRS